MIVSLGGGQGSEPDRWAYSHGYSGYLLDDPTLEINDQGLPFYTVTLLSPRLGWTFDAPVGVLVIDAHTGRITRYALGDVPSWVDRVYSQRMAMTIANWYGEYSQAGFQGIGSSNANRFQVSGDPFMVYTGAGHPFWRMLLTSHNNDSSVSTIIEMNAATGATRIYTLQRPMGIEDPGHPGVRQCLRYQPRPRPRSARRPSDDQHLEHRRPGVNPDHSVVHRRPRPLHAPGS